MEVWKSICFKNFFYYSVVLIANFKLTRFMHLIILKQKMHAILVQKITISV